ncbi:MAG: hypothetical protein ACM3UL_05215 [Ignavibacteria bacterium]
MTKVSQRFLTNKNVEWVVHHIAGKGLLVQVSGFSMPSIQKQGTLFD